MIRHLPGEPVDGVQRCQWCKAILIEWTGDEQVLEQDPKGAFYFSPNVEIVHEGPFMGTNKHQETGELIDTESPLCTPMVEGVDIK